ncbi:MAG: ATP-binding cassette domain-containing protein [Thermomicrobiales bacterium]
MAAVITVENLHKTYGSTVAVEDVSFTVAEGEIFGILGPNGAGKTTTVECLQGSGGPTARRAESSTRRQNGAGRRRRIGSQLQSSALPGRLKVREALELFILSPTIPSIPTSCSPAGGWKNSAIRRSTASRAASASGCSSHWRSSTPELVFLDELTQGLDPSRGGRPGI